MKAMIRKATALGLAALLGCAALTGCGKGAAIDPSKTLMTVNGEDIRLGVGSFYAKYTQAQIYQFYNMYFGGSNSIFGSVSNEETGETYGDSMKQSALDDVKKMAVISQHAEEYGVSLTDEDNQKIDEAAQAFFDNNDEEIIKKIGAEKEDVVKLLTMQTLQAKMMDPIVKDVDTNVSDEEAQQTTVTYVRIDAETESEAATAESEAESAAESATESAAESEAASAAESAASAAESTTESAAESEAASAAESAASAAESTTESAAESTAAESEAAAADEAEETPAQVEAREYAEAVLDAVKAEADIEAADMDAIAKTIDADYYSISGKFTTNDKTDTTLDANIVAAVEGLSDHTLVDHVVRSTDGNTYFVVRLDNNADEAATETKKTSIIRERKQELYDETTDGWVEGAEITVDEDIWKLVTMSDSDPITLKAPEAESTVEEAESAAESAVSAAESAASEAVSAVEDAASEVASAEEEAVSEATSAVEEAVSAAEEAVSEVASAAEEAASEVASAAEEAVSEAASAAESAAN